MIREITVKNYLNEQMTIDVLNPITSGFAVLDVDGLGPPKANIITNDLPTTDGSIFNSSRATKRNLVLNLKFVEDLQNGRTIEDARLLSYKYFPIKRQVELYFTSDKRKAMTTGWVDSNEPLLWSSWSTTQISIVCPKSYLYSFGDNGRQVTVFHGVEANFEFPYSNESLTDNLKEMSTIRSLTEGVVVYDGDSEIGVTIHMSFLGATKGITIYNTTGRQVMKFNDARLEAILKSPIKAGDEIILNTVQGDKSVFLLRDGQYINILNALERRPNWFTISKGDNVFVYEASTGITNILFRIENDVLYEAM